MDKRSVKISKLKLSASVEGQVKIHADRPRIIALCFFWLAVTVQIKMHR